MLAWSNFRIARMLTSKIKMINFFIFILSSGDQIYWWRWRCSFWETLSVFVIRIPMFLLILISDKTLKHMIAYMIFRLSECFKTKKYLIAFMRIIMSLVCCPRNLLVKWAKFVINSVKLLQAIISTTATNHAAATFPEL